MTVRQLARPGLRLLAADAKYSLIVNTRAMEPGYSIGISKRNAGIDGTITLVETTNRKKILESTLQRLEILLDREEALSSSPLYRS